MLSHSLHDAALQQLLDAVNACGATSAAGQRLREFLRLHGLLGGAELVELVEKGVIDAPGAHVNAASVDVRLGGEFLFETTPPIGALDVDLATKAEPQFTAIRAGENQPVYACPGEFFLAHTVETLALPDDVSCLFLLRSSCARAGLEHSQAGFGDAGFHGQLTLELKNILQYHRLVLRPGMRIGQLVFLRHADSGERSYRLKGRYGGQTGVQVSKGTA